MKVQFFLVVGEKGKSEVNNLHLILLIYHYIIQFNIPMSNFLSMQILHALNDAAEDFLCFLLRNSLFRLLLQVLVQRCFTDVFHH